MKDLEMLRAELNETDATLLQAFERRMQLAEEVADFKAANGMECLQPKQEERKIASARAACPHYPDEAEELMAFLMALSRRVQEARMQAHRGSDSEEDV